MQQIAWKGEANDEQIKQWNVIYRTWTSKAELENEYEGKQGQRSVFKIMCVYVWVSGRGGGLYKNKNSLPNIFPSC